MTYEQQPLAYDFDALEPHIDTETMKTHYSKHHTGYIKKYNAAIEGTEYEELSLDEVIKNVETLPEDIKTNIRNNGGGALNHTMFWEIMCPEKESGKPEGQLLEAINDAFGSLEHFKDKFSEAASTVFGSGWAWLVKGEKGKLSIMKTHNQENPLTEGKTPILGIDVWEHAYYLKYKNLRPDYIKAFFNIINWKQVEKNYLSE